MILFEFTCLTCKGITKRKFNPSEVSKETSILCSICNEMARIKNPYGCEKSTISYTGRV